MAKHYCAWIVKPASPGTDAIYCGANIDHYVLRKDEDGNSQRKYDDCCPRHMAIIAQRELDDDVLTSTVEWPAKGLDSASTGICASDLGLRPGEFPIALYSVLREATYRFNRHSRLEDGGWRYYSYAADKSISVFND